MAEEAAKDELEASPELIEAAAAIIREWANSDEWSGRGAATEILALLRRWVSERNETL